jgi:RNA polymerase sigma-70 factor (sigma-E family)
VDSWGSALTELVSVRLAALKRMAFLLCGDDDEAEDLVQDALVRAFARPFRVPRPEAAEAYVRRTITNVFIDRARRGSRWNQKVPLLTVAAVVADPADQVVAQDVLRRALGELPARQRACIVLRYYQDLPVTEVAAALGVREGTVKRYLSEAIARMAAYLTPLEKQ